MAPAELEAHLLLHPHVADACVVGVPDEYSGEIPFAFIVLSEIARELIKDDAGARDVSNTLSEHRKMTARVDPATLLVLLEQHSDELQIPSEEAITDKSKSDTVTKSLILVQII